MNHYQAWRKEYPEKADLMALCAAAVRQNIADAEVILYGSVARGEETAESDIDLLVLVPQVVTPARRACATLSCWSANRSRDYQHRAPKIRVAFRAIELYAALCRNRKRGGTTLAEKPKEVVAHPLQRARETLASAKVLEDSHFYFGAINRLYYARFYAVTALLETQGLSSSKHSGVMSLFNRHFVKTGLVHTTLGEFYGDLFETRHEGNYTDFAEFTPNEILELYDTAASFIDAITLLIEKEMQ